ncbi:hypothetical protein TARRARE_3 [Escherichia phage vB_Ec_Tarrare]|uniref:Uncharacterized protein n=1 Tax=Escherichia phage vB_Ec_Tarrare TaxID=3032379 RepID=A0AAF0ICQ8_9CAUD|nr:hypothetical protein TARRARE_3 [Escherichia phage vB_Ec_Tarrare]
MRNFEKTTRSKARNWTYEEVYGNKEGRKFNKTKRDRSHKRNWEAQ